MQQTNHTIGANVRAEMARMGVSQEALGEHLGLKQPSVSARLRGQTPFRVDELAAVAALLGVSLDVLLTGVGVAA